MSALSLDCPSLSATLELPYSPAQPPATQLGLANLTLWLNSEIGLQLHGRGAFPSERSRSMTRFIAKSVIAKMNHSATQQELIWLISAEVDALLAVMSSDNPTHGCELRVVPTEMHHSMTRTPLPALHPTLRPFAWLESTMRGAQSILSKLVAGFVPDSPST